MTKSKAAARMPKSGNKLNKKEQVVSKQQNKQDKVPVKIIADKANGNGVNKRANNKNGNNKKNKKMKKDDSEGEDDDENDSDDDVEEEEEEDVKTTKSPKPAPAKKAAQKQQPKTTPKVDRPKDLKRLHVGGFDKSAKEDDLKKLFPNNVEFNLPVKQQTKRNLGFAFVKFNTEAEAKLALEATNGKAFNGKALNVDYAFVASTDAKVPAAVAQKTAQVNAADKKNDKKRKLEESEDDDDDDDEDDDEEEEEEEKPKPKQKPAKKQAKKNK